jgi:AcrR family transcriptional regulator
MSEMADSTADGPTATARPPKRERLIAAACEVIYRQGVERATLADIAEAADVPVGNVYYYFKTKDDIIAGVAAAYVQHFQSAVADLQRQYRTPKTRLKALVRFLAEQRNMIADYGCPHGTLCSELGKQNAGSTPPIAALLMQVPIEWAEQQFRAMGRGDAHDLAVELMAAYEGSAVLTHALAQPEVMARQARRLERRIDAL